VKSLLLDANTLIYAINDEGGVRARLNNAALAGQLLTGAIAVAELLYGAERSQHREDNRRHIFKLIKRVKALPFDLGAAEHLAVLRAHFERIGMRRPRLDLMHAAQARAAGAVLVSTDDDLKRVRIPALDVEDWHTPTR
jgi:tRNA(fMet)-specific endonuclease VapC